MASCRAGLQSVLASHRAGLPAICDVDPTDNGLERFVTATQRQDFPSPPRFSSMLMPAARAAAVAACAPGPLTDRRDG